MDVVEILMVDHLSIRMIIKCGLTRMGVDEFSSLHGFIVNCHARIEDDLVFPVLKKHYMDSYEEYAKLVEWIGNDHRLLETLGNKTISYGIDKDWINYRRRLNLYFKILVEHNLREEVEIFPNWLNEIDRETRRKYTAKAKEIIEEYGLEKYTRLTGFSSEAFKII